MKKIVGYLRDYLKSLNKPLFLLATLFTALVVFVNYRFNLNKKITRLDEPAQFAAWYSLFLLAFGYGYFLQVLFLKSRIFRNKKFLALLLVAPAIFAWKMSAHIQYDFATDLFADEYWNAVVYWPFKVVVIVAMLHIVYRVFDKGQPFYGVTLKGFQPRPYVIMLLLMIPLIALASTQKDFLRMYPRFQSIEYLLQPNRGFYKLLYELSYGTDFFSIELFFRGFLVLAFAKWVGKEAVLPMAIFYCTIHFGKPLGECISSYFGGLILGVVAYNTRTIFGGFLVHVGIAWLMESGGYLGHIF
ncbi:CPBP family intramembrane glutamic endopeptidase [Flavisolibacter ginsenosidimutans]|uniref:CPBP family intramembrane metalloprotease n=1 Tax=Flavisolibacter ginsenosidimutans TaxID=661481 RepID=A0A5B8UD79_9BACT|nr:CPBP family intramembrane glutamic endopeptidase [Flavisolibacter ginsenosidimutans]QEC54631.1 CPBP family intramembrane metalloprotease [Flavisolibacter ginsenosidimutans]